MFFFSSNESVNKLIFFNLSVLWEYVTFFIVVIVIFYFYGVFMVFNGVLTITNRVKEDNYYWCSCLTLENNNDYKKARQ
jgi:hypothetical protein